MRRHVSLILSLLVVAGGATAAGVATAAAATRSPAAAPHVTIKIGHGSQCHPTASYCFEQTAVSVASGTKVTWKNPTIAPHTVTRCSAVPCNGVGGGTGTDNLGGSIASGGGKYTFKFKGKGTYTYYCTVHGYPLMHGTITVT
jgi:plastocyanin